MIIRYLISLALCCSFQKPAILFAKEPFMSPIPHSLNIPLGLGKIKQQPKFSVAAKQTQVAVSVHAHTGVTARPEFMASSPCLSPQRTEKLARPTHCGSLAYTFMR